MAFDFGNFGASVLQGARAEVIDATSSAALITPGSGAVVSTTGGVLAANGSTIEVTDSSGVAPGSTGPAPNNEFSAVSFTFTAQSGSSTIRLTDIGAGGADSSDGILDNVRITLVPEPASLSMLALASIGLLTRRRRH